VDRYCSWRYHQPKHQNELLDVYNHNRNGAQQSPQFFRYDAPALFDLTAGQTSLRANEFALAGEKVLKFAQSKRGALALRKLHLYLTELGGFHAGGWSKFAAPGGEALAAFKEAVGDGTFTPLLVTSQVVNGTNYIFLANLKIIVARNVRPMLVRIQKPPGGAAVRTGLETPGFPFPAPRGQAFTARPAA
jgi:hypothetical protein